MACGEASAQGERRLHPMSKPAQLKIDGTEVPHDEVVGEDSRSRMVRRPRESWGDLGAVESDGYQQRIHDALDAAGVEPGEAFYVSRVPPKPKLDPPFVRDQIMQAVVDSAHALTPGYNCTIRTREIPETGLVEIIMERGEPTQRELEGVSAAYKEALKRITIKRAPKSYPIKGCRHEVLKRIVASGSVGVHRSWLALQMIRANPGKSTAGMALDCDRRVRELIEAGFIEQTDEGRLVATAKGRREA